MMGVFLWKPVLEIQKCNCIYSITIKISSTVKMYERENEQIQKKPALTRKVKKTNIHVFESLRVNRNKYEKICQGRARINTSFHV